MKRSSNSPLYWSRCARCGEEKLTEQMIYTAGWNHCSKACALHSLLDEQKRIEQAIRALIESTREEKKE